MRNKKALDKQGLKCIICCPTRIRTLAMGSKNPCATVTPWDKIILKQKNILVSFQGCKYTKNNY